MAEPSPAQPAAAKAPISTHPAFPAIVALWFAALLGLGTLVLPAPLLERLVTTTGIARIFPSATPPLGFAARAAMALVAAIAGSLAGLALARKVARLQAGEAQASPAASPRRPLSAADDLGEEGLGTPAAAAGSPAQKRRSLAMSEDNRRSLYLQTVPLPGQDDLESAGDPLAAAAAAAFPHEEPAGEPAVLELDGFVDPADTVAAADGSASDRSASSPSRAEPHSETSSLQDRPMIDLDSFSFSADDGFAGDRQQFQPVAMDTVAAGDAEPAIPEAFEPVGDAVDPLPFAAPSLRRQEPSPSLEQVHFEGPDASENDFFAESYDAFEEIEPAAEPYLSVVESEPQDEELPEDDGRPLEDLGLVQLAARLGASLERRRALMAEHASASPTIAAPAPLVASEDFEAAEPEEAARAIADFFAPARPAEPLSMGGEDELTDADAFFDAPAPSVPQSLRGWSLDAEEDEEDDNFVSSFSLPLHDGNGAADDDITDEAEDDDGDEDSDSYSSLLAMKNPFAQKQEFVRVEEPDAHDDEIEPMVTFPSAAPLQAAEPAEPDFGAPVRPFDPPRNRADSAAGVPAPRDTADAERNLRAALATLQRMSGAA